MTEKIYVYIKIYKYIHTSEREKKESERMTSKQPYIDRQGIETGHDFIVFYIFVSSHAFFRLTTLRPLNFLCTYIGVYTYSMRDFSTDQDWWHDSKWKVPIHSQPIFISAKFIYKLALTSVNMLCFFFFFLRSLEFCRLWFLLLHFATVRTCTSTARTAHNQHSCAIHTRRDDVHRSAFVVE